MKTYSKIKEKWKLCALTCIFGCIIMLFSYTYNQNEANLTLLQSIVITQTSSQPYIDDAGDNNLTAQIPVHEAKNFTGECNYVNGNWVYKPESYPLYNVLQCPFLSQQVSCQNNGRPDFEYEHWTWEANGCAIPRFNGLDMLERIRDKRVTFVGDSLNRNQWESLACLLYINLQPTRTHVEVDSSFYKVLRSEEYNCTVEFYWSSFLVQLDGSKGKGKVILRLDQLDSTANHWEGADIMVFNTGNWWMHPGILKSWDVFEHDGELDETMELESAMEMALKTWANWVETKVDKRKTRVFFRSITAAHYDQHACFGITMPLLDEESSRVYFPKLVGKVVEPVIGSMKVPIKYLNVTKLTQYRVDGHPGMFSMKEGQVHQDCSHWCLPGVPDQWNRHLYASLVLDKSLSDDQNATIEESEVSAMSFDQISETSFDQKSENPESLNEPGNQKANETDLSENPNDLSSLPDVQIPELSNDVQDQKANETEISENPNDLTSLPDVQIPELSNGVQDQKANETKISENPNDPTSLPDVQIPELSNDVQDPKQQEEENEKFEECDISDGKWVYNPEAIPLYADSECPFINVDYTCQVNKRPDSEYVKWSWEPNGCRIPKFNGTDLAERLRGKRVVFVGDSISRNQWESFICLLHSALQPSKTRTKTHNNFIAEEYDLSVDYFWDSFLVELEVINGTKILNLDGVSPTINRWKDADILVFNTGHWWEYPRWDTYRYNGELIKDMNKDSAFKVAMNTWARSIDTNVDSNKTRVFFRSYSPVHSCYQSKIPLTEDEYGTSGMYSKSVFETVEKTISIMSTQVEYLNITKLAQYRADAHPGYYIGKPNSLGGDCSHWCLPGIPDTWNSIFYGNLLRPRKSRDVQTGQQLEDPQNTEMPNNVDEQTPELSIDIQDPKQQEEEFFFFKECDITEGRWVYNPEAVPLYADSECPFIDVDYACQVNKRPDSEYVKWSWEPTGCHIPKFNGTDLAERLRGKRVVFVGDSISRNQWESFVCLLHSALPPSTTKAKAHNIFISEEYNFSIEQYWDSFLVELEVVNGTKILNLDGVSPLTKLWKDADILMFNTGHWWAYPRWDSFRYKGKLIKKMNRDSAFKVAMNTWARSIDSNVDSNKTRVFFKSYSPSHSCYQSKKPLTEDEYKKGGRYSKSIFDIAEKTISGMSTEVEYLNITKFSQYRADAHPGYYIGKPNSLGGDCSHWCLPGVPDTWNSIFYANLLLPRKSRDVQTGQQLEDTQNTEIPNNVDEQIPELSTDVQDTKQQEEELEKFEECDMSEGKWVYNPEAVPLYADSECPFIKEDYTCQVNKRPDSEYVKWSWEPTGCRIPKFNGTDMVERLRGKRLVFVGDSIGRNQWESFVCLLYSVLPPGKKRAKSFNIFVAEEYNLSVEYYWDSFLVELEGVNGTKILNLDGVSPSTKLWKDADILMFNTGHWWEYPRWDAFRYRGKLIKKMNRDSAFKVAMNTWSRWVDSNVDSTKTRVFFKSYSPVHSCYQSKKPLTEDEYKKGGRYSKSIFDIAEKTISGMSTRVEYLNITKFSQYRADAHPGWYVRSLDKVVGGDCSHWCLPGVPDTWNLIFYAHLLRPRKSVDAQNNQQLETPQNLQMPNNVDKQIPEPSNDVQVPKQQEDEKEEECDIFEGRWVYNPQWVPPYGESECPFVNKDFTCQMNGRPDSEYKKWSWEPTGCQIPKFNGMDLAEMLRGKRLVFVGDSISRNQWESMVCLLHSALPPSKTKSEVYGGANSFRSDEYNCSVEFYWNSFLVELEVENGTKILNLNQFSTTTKQWQDADFIVFNTGHWWVTQRWDIYRYNGKLIKDMNRDLAFKVAMKTWARSIDSIVDRTKTRVFFRSYSPVHSCYKNQKPLDDYRYGSFPKPIFDTIENTISGMSTQVEYLNITRLTQYRADAHPGYYINQKRGRLLLKKKHQGGDCSHWCLPGLPDTWNTLLYAKLLRQKKSEDVQQVEEPRKIEMPNQVSIPNEQVAQPSDSVWKANVTDKEKCDIFDGKWVYDPHPSLYTESTCPFINSQFTCQQNGRQDFRYANWRWEATGCQIPRFDGKDMLKRLRGKRVIFVGDSINKNQFESLSCLLYSALTPAQAKYADNKAHFTVKGYDISLEFYLSPFLIQLDENYVNGSKTLRLDTISETAKQWKGADIMVFNTGHWWTHKGPLKNWDSYEHNGKVVDNMATESAFAAMVQTWARWVDRNVDSSKTKVFFRGVSPVHSDKHKCLGKTEPLNGDDYSITGTYPEAMRVALERTFETMKTPVKYLNITKLSEMRVDGHPGYHGRPRRILRSSRRKHKKPQMLTTPEQSKLTPEEISKQPQWKHDRDCSHWCLPGVPDTWNKLLYASIVLDGM